MKIAFVNQPWDTILPSLGGPGSSLAIISYELARRLVKCGHDVTVYGAGARLDLGMRVEFDQGIEFRSMRGVKLEGKLFEMYHTAADRFVGKPSTERARFASKHYLGVYGWQVARTIARGAPDVIHIHNLFQLTPAIRKLNPSAKIILHMNCSWLSQIAPDIIEEYLSHVDLIFGASDYITDRIKERYPSYASRCLTVYNGVDMDGFSRPPLPREADEPKRILFVGRISPEKGVHLLLNAFAKVHEAHPDVVLDLVGHYAPVPFELLVGISEDHRVRDLAVFYDPSKSSYMDQVRALVPPSMTEKVRFRGGVPYTEIVEEYRKADIFVNASYSEGFCLPVVEATGYGLPVVAARAGGNAEMVVDGETGFVFEIGDEQALADAMTRLVRDSSLREQMGKAGRQRVLEAFSYDAIVNKMEATYKSLL